MLSHAHRCLFTEVPKTASSSIRALLGQPPKPHLDLLQIREAYRAELRPAHGDAQSRAMADEVFASYFKFGFVRNPWDRCVSLYRRVEAQVAQPMSFAAFVEWIQYASDNCLHPTPHRHQLDWFRDAGGNIVADFIGRFENLAADWEIIRERLGITADLPHANAHPRRDPRHYSEYYTPETRAIIGEKFALDIEHFGYAFEDAGHGRIIPRKTTAVPAGLALSPGTRWEANWLADAPPGLGRGAQLLVFFDAATLGHPKWVPFLKVIHRQPALPRVLGILPSTAAPAGETQAGFPLATLDAAVLGRLVTSFPTAILLQDGLQSGSPLDAIPAGLMTTVRELYRQELRQGPPQNAPSTRKPAAPSPALAQANPAVISRPAPLIERRATLTAAEFWNDYFAHDRPVIMTGMTGHWPATKNWTPAYLSERFGGVEVEIQAARNTDPDYELRIAAHRKTVLFKDYIADVLHGGETNDYYMVANNHNLEKEALKGLTGEVDLSPFRDDQPLEGRCFLWFGPGGTITPLHYDAVPVLFAQFHGRKRWRIIHPDHGKYLYNHKGVFSEVDAEKPDLQTHPLYAQAITTEIILNPGELLFLPQGWWHQVKALDVSISFSYSLRRPVP